MNTRTMLVALLVGLWGVGCPSEAPEEVVQAEGAPVLMLSQANLDFFPAEVGEEQFGSVELSNVGGAPLEVRGLNLQGSEAFSLVDAPQLPQFLQRGQSLTLEVRFSPVGNGSHEGYLYIETNFAADGITEVRMRGGGLAPTLTVSPSALDFGDVDVGCVAERVLTLSNSGGALLTVTEATFEDLAGGGEIAIDLSVAQAPFVMPPGASRSLDVTYRPADEIPDTAALRLVSDDPERPSMGIAVSGRAAPLSGTPVVDAVGGTSSDQVDVLLVVDDSAGTGDLQSGLANQFALFFTETMYGLGVDYRVAVISADPSEGGIPTGTTPFVTPTTPDPAGTLAANLNLGTTGGTPGPLDAALLALSPPNTDPGGATAQFRRAGAELRIIVVTNEGTAHTLASAQDYVDALSAQVLTPSDLIISAISGGASGCSAPSGAAPPAPLLADAVGLTGGSDLTVCYEQWSSWGGQLGQEAQPEGLVLPLSETPWEPSMAVFLSTDGVQFAELHTGWSYDDGLNLVVFDDGVVNPTDAVEVHYVPAPDCD